MGRQGASLGMWGLIYNTSRCSHVYYDTRQETCTCIIQCHTRIIPTPTSFFFVSEPMQPPAPGPLDTQTFSKGMSCDQLTAWLTSILGEDYQEDIRKFKGKGIPQYS